MKVDKKRVGVVIPSMGNKKYVLNLIPTIKSNHHELFLVSIDNGSNDGLPFELNNLYNAGVINELEIHPNPLGVAAAWNRGINKCIENNCDYIMVLNTDILLHKDCIDHLVDFYDKNKTLLVATAQTINPHVGYDHKVNLPEDQFNDLKSKINGLDLSGPDSIGGPDFACFMLTNDFVEKVGLFDERFYGAYFEDNDAHWRVIKTGHGAASTSRSGFFHFGSRSIWEGSYHNSNFTHNENYFKSKHGTHTTDGSQCPGWTSLLGKNER